MSTFVFFFIPETKRLTLEEMDVIFGAVDANRRREDIEATLAAEKKEFEMEENENVQTKN